MNYVARSGKQQQSSAARAIYNFKWNLHALSAHRKAVLCLHKERKTDRLEFCQGSFNVHDVFDNVRSSMNQKSLKKLISCYWNFESWTHTTKPNQLNNLIKVLFSFPFFHSLMIFSAWRNLSIDPQKIQSKDFTFQKEQYAMAWNTNCFRILQRILY